MTRSLPGRRRHSKLYGYMKVPFEPQPVQNQKSGGIEGEESALDGISEIIEHMEEDVLYIIDLVLLQGLLWRN